MLEILEAGAANKSFIFEQKALHRQVIQRDGQNKELIKKDQNGKVLKQKTNKQETDRCNGDMAWWQRR